MLGKIEVEGETRPIPHFLFLPVPLAAFSPCFYELDKQGAPFTTAPYNGEVLPSYMYTDTGFWDTFRCLLSFLNLMYPSVNREIQEGLVNTYKESGFFPNGRVRDTVAA